jgi:hypothetical protein
MVGLGVRETLGQRGLPVAITLFSDGQIALVTTLKNGPASRLRKAPVDRHSTRNGLGPREPSHQIHGSKRKRTFSVYSR